MGFWDDVWRGLKGYGEHSGINNFGRSLGQFPAFRNAVNQTSSPNNLSGGRFTKDPASIFKPRNQTPPKPPGPSITDILARLEELQNPSRYMMDPYLLEQQARHAASAQYDPLIAELYNQMRSAETRAGRQKTELGQMFGALSTNLSQDIPKVQKTFENTRQSTQKEYDELQGMIKGQYSESQKEQEDMLKRLNIEAAAPDILPEQQRDRDYFTSLAQKEAQTTETALGMEERGATEFTRQGSQIAQMEGTSRQATLMQQLQDLLTTYESQIGSHKAAKEHAYSAGLIDLQNQMATQAQTQAQRDFENYIKSIQLGRDLRKDELIGMTGEVKSPADVSGRALTMGLDQYGAQQVQNIFMSAVGNDPLILAGVDPTYGTSVPREALAARIVEQGRNAGLSQSQLNVLQTIALEYFGRR